MALKNRKRQVRQLGGKLLESYVVQAPAESPTASRRGTIVQPAKREKHRVELWNVCTNF